MAIAAAAKYNLHNVNIIYNTYKNTFVMFNIIFNIKYPANYTCSCLD